MFGEWMQQQGNFIVLPALGPAPAPKPSSPEFDVYEWLIEGYEKRGLIPPKYDELKSGEKQVQNILRTIKEWLITDEKSFWKALVLTKTFNGALRTDIKQLSPPNHTGSRSSGSQRRQTLTALPEKMKASLDPFMLATDVADYLVRKGVPFRETHHISGRCVAKSEETGIPMNELSYETLKAIDERFEEDIADVFNYEACAESRTAKAAPARQLFSSRSRSSKRFSVKKGHWALMNEMIRR